MSCIFPALLPLALAFVPGSIPPTLHSLPSARAGVLQHPLALAFVHGSDTSSRSATAVLPPLSQRSRGLTRVDRPPTMAAGALAPAEPAARIATANGTAAADPAAAPIVRVSRTAALDAAPGLRLAPDVAEASDALVGSDMQARWDRLRSRPLRRYVALNAFMAQAAWRMFRANRTDDAVLTNATALWVRDGLLRLGPTMIKLGQVFSTRTDLLHPAYVAALASLQTDVPTVPFEAVRAQVRTLAKHSP